MHHMYTEMLWKRILLMVVLWLIVNRFAKKRFLKKAQDSHEPNRRDVAGHH